MSQQALRALMARRTLTSHSGTEQGGHRIRPGHLLQNGDKEPNLYLSRMLQKTVKSGCALCLGENLEPYTNMRDALIRIEEQTYIARWRLIPP